jgi:peptidyl-dipeptidase Dcp
MNANDIHIRTQLKPGDIGYITYLHGIIYEREYNYDYNFESYVAAGLHEFALGYNPGRDRVWICEHENKIIGGLFLKGRGEEAQLRYFILLPEYRGIGLGKKLMEMYIEFMKQAGYSSSYLWTTHELDAAASLYRRFGFKLTEEKTHTVWGKHLTEQRYDLVL